MLFRSEVVRRLEARGWLERLERRADRRLQRLDVMNHAEAHRNGRVVEVGSGDRLFGEAA